MRYAVIGGDMRFAHLVSMLEESGREARGFFQQRREDAAERLGEYDSIITNWPMRFPLVEGKICGEEIIGRLGEGSRLLCVGPGFPEEGIAGLKCVNLWADERLLRENAYLTAEAAVATAMRHSGGVRGRRSAVIGYGRIGSALVEILGHMGSEVTLYSRSAEKRRMAGAAGALALDMEEIADSIGSAELIFSTSPALVLDEGRLARVSKEAMLIDLASPPYGFELEEAREKGLRAYREPGLPGRYCPLSAARVIYGAVVRWEESEMNG